MLELTEAEMKSSTWQKILEHCEQEISMLRIKNDSLLLKNDETMFIRGQIKALKDLKDARQERMVFSRNEIPGLIDDTPIY